MSVGFKRIDAVTNPDDLLDTQVLGKLLLNLLARVLRVAILVEQTHLGRHHGALAIAVE